MKIRVRHYDTEVELELPDHGPEFHMDNQGYNKPKHRELYKDEDRAPSHVALEMIQQACNAIRAIREGGAQ